MSNVIDGKKIAQNILDSVKIRVSKLATPPKLIIITYNPDERSKLYINLKLRKAEEVGIVCQIMDWSNKDFNYCKLEMKKIADSDSVNGIIAQLPMSGLEDYQQVLNLIPEKKDIDGLSEKSVEHLRASKQVIFPATPKAILEVINRSDIDLNGKNILIIGQGKLVGLPLGIILKNKNLNVETVDNSSSNIKGMCLRADIIITAAGSPNLLRGDMVKNGVVVLDAGASEVNSKIVGDVDYETVEPKASIISKVPGGIGPVTVACLLDNLLHE